MKLRSKYLISCAGAGLINGLLGAGGGAVLAPLLIRWCGLPEKRAFATSVFLIFPLSAVSAAVYFSTGRVSLALALPYLVGGFFGGLLSGPLLGRVPVLWLRRLFGGVLLVGGLRMLL